MKIICCECKKEFELSDGEKQFYLDKGLTLPKRCKACRNKKNTNGAAAFWAKKPLWVSVLALALIIAAAFFLNRGGEEFVPSIPSNTTSTIEADKPPALESEAESDSANSSLQESGTAKEPEYFFKSESHLDSHWEKHGGEFDYETKAEYVSGANRVINDPNALTKTEKEDGDFVFYLEETNELVILSTDGYIRTYFKPDSGLDYFNRQ